LCSKNKKAAKNAVSGILGRPSLSANPLPPKGKFNMLFYTIHNKIYFHVPGLKPPALAGELLAIEKARKLR
jgi:hypothetical protein